ncbi:hypothetical protein DICPUDRAFT_98088 [Dictyostelium purpureum]|uniref:G8 domain-containing protein n=1 Tax=Dictyostelium purpureum TaxID=5786 RepID=F0ZML5_DICPU|nr:uncharacterized protein DICPUDRAFT_98088 [Dictyostelium purpureum]EGC34813.1 hypothetical protein DICPUDRAFT_98088 [Dictyostelium purpureum]|eukprot:XP_003288670.1 hypothetical protein DICPUDRAFT_98088 [Dictyostelium purpureum]
MKLNWLSILLIFILYISNVLSYISTCNGPDIYTENLKKWSDVSSWTSGKVPVEGDMVQIPSGDSILLDVSTPRLTQIWIQSGGQLIVSSRHGPLEITTDGILIEGRFDIGDDNCRFNESITITLTGIEGQGYIESRGDFLQKYVGVLAGGRLEIHGYLSYPIPTWTKLTKTITTGATILNLLDDVSKWPVGSQIVIGSTDFDMYQSEEVYTLDCPECTNYQLKINGTRFYHFGAITYGVDERAEVGLLTKNIVIRGEMQPSCNGSALCNYFNFDGFGGHVRVAKGFGSVHLQGIELYHMGQIYNVGFYPIHFHMCGDVDTGSYSNWPTFVKDVSIHHTFSRCLTIHGTSGLIVVSNFAYDHYGHCYFFEDGSETRNYLDSNVGLVTRYGYILPSDRSCEVCLYVNPKDYNGNALDCGTCEAVATFWITNPDNYLRNNIAGGSENTGFWFLIPEGVSGLSAYLPQYQNIHAEFIPIGSFNGNKAHSNVLQGLNIDQGHQIHQQNATYPNPYLSMTYSRYKPRVDPLNPWTSERATALVYGYTGYKNKWRGAWARGGDVVFHSSYFSENAIGLTMGSEGVMQADAGSTQQCIGCTFILETENVGMSTNGVNTYGGVTIPAWYEFTQRGLELYDGPFVCQYCTFINFNTDGNRITSGIGWFLYDDWILASTTTFSGTTFQNTNLAVHNLPSNYDGAKNQIFHDADGTITGTYDSYVVPNVPYFYSPKCVANTLWNTTVCTEKFASLYIYNKDLSASSIPNGAGVIMIRDEYSYYRHYLQGVPNTSPRSTFMPLVMLGKSYTMHFPHPTPPHLQVQMTNFNANDSTVVGICYPTWGVTFEITKQVIVSNWAAVTEQVVMVDSLDAVKADPKGLSAFYDSNTGLLFLNVIQERTREWNYYCPELGCETYDIQISGLGVNTNTGDCSYLAYPTYAKMSYATRGGCNGSPDLVIDACGICGGDGKSCNAKENAVAEGNSDASSLLSKHLSKLLFSIFIILFITIMFFN